MTDEQLTSIGESMERVAGVFAEFRRQWHPSMGGQPPFNLLDECLSREADRIRGAGQAALADGLAALRSDLGSN